jgi:hypothetical protein
LLKRLLKEQLEECAKANREKPNEVLPGVKAALPRDHSVDGLLTPLQVDALRLANEIQAFYAELGPPPEYPKEMEDGTKEGIWKAFHARNEKLLPYRKRLEHGFELRFAERTRKLVHEFAEKGIQNSSIRITEVDFPFLGIEEEAALPSDLRRLANQLSDQGVTP